MTILDVKTKIVSYLSKNDIIKESDLPEIIEDKDIISFSIALKALEELESSGLISKLENGIVLNSGNFWVLTRPFNMYEQTVKLSANTCNHIASIINEYCEVHDDDTNKCDPLNISDFDILNLIKLYFSVASSLTSDENFEE